ncbi:MAG: TRAM domain-containing protein, partial [Phycisphaerae bacterium]|nr:TRAM domain-containing protein [Phycisphaerae bacterium]
GISRREEKKASRRRESPGAVALTVFGRGSMTTAAVDEAAQATVQLSGRTDGDQIVFVDVPGTDGQGRSARSLIGRIVPVQVTSARSLGLMGRVV